MRLRRSTNDDGTRRPLLFRARESNAPVGPSSVSPMIATRFAPRGLPADFADLAGLFAGGPDLLARVGTAARCLQLCSQQIASSPLRYRRDTPAPEGRDYAPPWIAAPDPAWYPNGIRDAIFASVWSMYAAGDAFLWATSRSTDGYPATWTVLDPRQVKVDSAGGSRTYTYAQTPLDAGDVLQITRNPTGALRGTGALEAYASNLTAAFQADAFSGTVFGDGGVPSAVLKSARRLTEDQANEVKLQWLSRVGGSTPAVLPPDLDFEQLAFSPKDLALLESREYDSKQIAAAFGVPAPLLNMTLAGGLTYQNPASLFDLWWRSELTPASKAIEEALGRWLPRGSWVEFDSSRATTPDFAALATTWIALVTAGIATENEARAAVLDLPELEQGEQVAMIDEPAGAQTSAGSETEPEPSRLEAVQ